MWNLLALLGTPSLSLANLSAVLALTQPACANQAAYLLHGVCALSVLLASLATLLAWRSGARDRPVALGGEAVSAFMWRIAVPVAALSTLVIAAQWLCVWILSPCVA